jgi:hypothetical protein
MDLRPLPALVATTLLAAHPGVGIVRDATGNVFYTDLKQVWRIGPDGTRSVAVPGVHTHELCLEPDGGLLGEHLWFEGEQSGRWGHRLWRLGPDGSLRDLIPARPGFLEDEGTSLVRDRAGTACWADRKGPLVLRRRLREAPSASTAGAPSPTCAG